MTFVMAIWLGLQTQTIHLHLVDEQKTPLADMYVRVETPLGVLSARTDEQGYIEVTPRYPRLTLFLGEPTHLVRVPEEVDLDEAQAAIEVQVPADVLRQVRGGS
jgi:hypothetical protein